LGVLEVEGGEYLAVKSNGGAERATYRLPLCSGNEELYGGGEKASSGVQIESTLLVWSRREVVEHCEEE
jgi:hypothetical protein